MTRALLLPRWWSGGAFHGLCPRLVLVPTTPTTPREQESEKHPPHAPPGPTTIRAQFRPRSPVSRGRTNGKLGSAVRGAPPTRPCWKLLTKTPNVSRWRTPTNWLRLLPPPLRPPPLPSFPRAHSRSQRRRHHFVRTGNTHEVRTSTKHRAASPIFVPLPEPHRV